MVPVVGGGEIACRTAGCDGAGGPDTRFQGGSLTQMPVELLALAVRDLRLPPGAGLAVLPLTAATGIALPARIRASARPGATEHEHGGWICSFVQPVEPALHGRNPKRDGFSNHGIGSGDRLSAITAR